MRTPIENLIGRPGKCEIDDDGFIAARPVAVFDLAVRNKRNIEMSGLEASGFKP